MNEAFKRAVSNREELLREKRKEERIRFPLEEELRSKMVGQVMPILNVAAAIRRRENGWHDEEKPMVMMFLGSSGVGKTMLAKAVAESINPDPGAFIRIDMSEYASKHETARLIGSPPGYVGHDDGGQLTGKLTTHPDAVVLLDEVEKAHPDVLTLMLQVFDEGRLTDGKGETIVCPGATFIMTSNLVQEHIREADLQGYILRPPSDTGKKGLDIESLRDSNLTKVTNSTNKFLRTVVQPILKAHFKRDEFLGRINDMVVFHHFLDSDIEDIVNMELGLWQKQAKNRHDITLSWTQDIITRLSGNFNERYGFRSIKHAVQKEIVNLLAWAHERGKIREGTAVEVAVEDHNIEDGNIILNVLSESAPKPPKSKGWLW